MTEDEAKTKWCPMARDTVEGMGSFNRKGTGKAVETTLCLGSACMAWRWAEGRGAGPVEETTESPPPKRGEGMRWYAGGPGRFGLFPRLGYCGLVGKP